MDSILDISFDFAVMSQRCAHILRIHPVLIYSDGIAAVCQKLQKIRRAHKVRFIIVLLRHLYECGD